jgi:membrane-bound inhibitor of C-type lysozyme
MSTAKMVIAIFGVFLFGVAAHSKAEPPLTVNLGPPVYYKSESGELFMARYGSLSDDSLHFVKIKTPGGRKYTLPQVMSASGARYTDDREIVWWTHHGVVRVDVRDDNGKWIVNYPELKEIRKTK